MVLANLFSELFFAGLLHTEVKIGFSFRCSGTYWHMGYIELSTMVYAVLTFDQPSSERKAIGARLRCGILISLYLYYL